MSCSLPRLADNLSEGLHKDKCKDQKYDFEYVAAKDKTLTLKCVGCNKNCEKKFDEDLAKRFKNNHKFCDGYLNKFCLMLWKGVCP